MPEICILIPTYIRITKGGTKEKAESPMANTTTTTKGVNMRTTNITTINTTKRIKRIIRVAVATPSKIK